MKWFNQAMMPIFVNIQQTMFRMAIMASIPDINDVEKGTSSQTKVQEDETHSHSSASPNNAAGGVSPVSSFGLIVQEVTTFKTWIQILDVWEFTWDMERLEGYRRITQRGAKTNIGHYFWDFTVDWPSK